MKKGNVENLEGKRGKKGGTTFPRYGLKHLSAFLKSLVSKTHINTIDIAQINAGVFGVGAKSIPGKVKCSALKQFGLLEGDYTKFKATELCSKITIADSGEQKFLFQTAFKNVKIFVNTLNTFQNSKAEKSKIGQYAVSTLKVHPDMKDDFTNVFVESAEISGLCTIEGNAITFSSFQTPIVPKVDLPEEHNEEDVDEEQEDENSTDINSNGKNENGSKQDNSQRSSQRKQGQVSNINVNIDVDPSMDPEKLEKLLKLLKNYGAI